MSGGRHACVISLTPSIVVIGGKTNRAISDKSPEVYLPPIIAQHGATPFAAQAIPTESSVLAVANYKSFLLGRRKLIAERLNQFLVPSARE